MMDKTILLATGNAGKFKEIMDELSPLGIRVLSLKDVAKVAECPETGATFFDNALQKAQYYAKASGYVTLADDSGIEVDALGGEPGVISARYAGEPCDDAANNAKLVRELAGVPMEKRTGRFRCVMVLVDADGQLLATTDGAIEGVIIDVPRGENGFGYDPHFFVPSLNKTTAEISRAEKNAISHRGKASRAMREKVKELLSAGR